MKRFSALVLVGLMAGALVRAEAQAVPALDAIKSDAELTSAISALDTQLFDAYNNCDLDKLGSMVVDDLEFYHDKTGLMVGKQPFLVAIKNNICGKVRRELVKGSLEVYPLKGFGAVEMCVHRFTHPKSVDPGPGGEAKSVMLWQQKDGAWTLTRVISFDHRSLGK